MDTLIGWAIIAFLVIAMFTGYVEYRTLKNKLDAVMKKLIDMKYR